MEKIFWSGLPRSNEIPKDIYIMLSYASLLKLNLIFISTLYTWLGFYFLSEWIVFKISGVEMYSNNCNASTKQVMYECR